MLQLIIIGFHPCPFTIIYQAHFLVGFPAAAVHDVVVAREAVGPVFLDLRDFRYENRLSMVSCWKISMCIISFPVGHLAGEICLLCHAMPEFLDVRVNFFSSSLRPLMAMWTELATATCSSRSFLREIQIKLAYNSYKVRPQMLLAKITHWTVSSSP
jgi:hypothetical protein